MLVRTIIHGPSGNIAPLDHEKLAWSWDLVEGAVSVLIDSSAGSVLFAGQ